MVTEYEHLHMCRTYKPVTNRWDSQGKRTLYKLKNSQKMPLKIRLIKPNPTTAPGHGPTTEFLLPVLGSVLTTASHWTWASHSRSRGLPAEQASQPFLCFSFSSSPLTPPHPPPNSSSGWARGHGQRKGSAAKTLLCPSNPSLLLQGHWQPEWFRAAFRLF